jgi:prepilin-type N-terminal cleavage/methylation domain-containing protein/prepilin-type processing-associated H-X9-DG protein
MGQPLHSRAFTLVELLVVVAIIAVLVALLMPALGRAKKDAIAVSCLSNQRQVANAVGAYTSEYGQILTVERDLDIAGAGYEIIPWAAFLCPPDPASYSDSRPWFPANSAVYLSNRAVVRCPAQTAPSTGWPSLQSSYAMQHSPSFNFPTAYQPIIRYENVYVGGGTSGTQVVATSGTSSGTVHNQGVVNGNTIGGYYLFMPGILRPSNFILLTDAQHQGASGGQQCTFADESGSGSLPWMLHNNKLNAMYADGHAETISAVQAYRAECPLYAFYTEDLVFKSEP